MLNCTMSGLLFSGCNGMHNMENLFIDGIALARLKLYVIALKREANLIAELGFPVSFCQVQAGYLAVSSKEPNMMAGLREVSWKVRKRLLWSLSVSSIVADV